MSRGPGSARRWNLSFILALSFTLLTLIALIIPVTTQTAWGYSRQQRLIRENTQTVAERTAAEVDSYIRQRVQALETAAWFEVVVAESDALRRDFLSRIVGRVRSFRQVALYDSEGYLVDSVSRLTADDPRRLPPMLGITGIDHDRLVETSVGSVYVDDITNEPNVVIASPVVDVFGVRLGTLVAELSLRFMWDLIGRVEIENGGYAYVVDRQGILLAHPDMTRVLAGEDTSALPLVASYRSRPTERRTMNERYVGMTGEEVVGAFVTMETTDWGLVIETPRNATFRPVRLQAIVSGAVTVFVVLVASVMAIYLGRRISVSIVDLTETAERIARGERGLTVRAQGPKEVAALADAFNSMTSQLRRALETTENQLHDIKRAQTDLQYLTARLEAILDHSPLAILLIDPDGTVRHWNRAACTMYGWTSEETVGKKIPLVPPDKQQEFDDFWHQVVERRRAVMNQRVQRQRRDGSRLWIDLSIAPLKSPTGRVTGLISVAADATEQEEARRQLVSSLREKEVMLKEIHHRVKNNLQVVSSILYLQEIGLTSPELVDALRTSRQRIKSMSIVHEQLYLSGNLAEIDFPRYVEALAENLLESYNAGDRVSLNTDMDPVCLSIETAVPCGLIVNELLTNSMKHAFPNGRDGTVFIEVKQVDTDQLQLTIRDDGVGMPIAGCDDRRPSLGVTIVDELVKQLHGTIETWVDGGTWTRVQCHLGTATPSGRDEQA
ncbi:MAG: sensor histidine kinase [Spirochaetota bacterium]